MKGVSLRTVQRWFAACIEHPIDAAAALATPSVQSLVAKSDVDAGRMVTANPRMSAADMLQVYNGGYLQRLLEVMAGDYGAVRFVLGEDAFRDLVARYLAAHPSRHPNLNRLGRRFPAFVRSRRRLGNRVFLGELASLELALCVAFDAPEFRSLGTDALGRVPQDRWGQACFQPNPSVQALRFRHAVDVFYQAWKDGKAPAVPAAEPSWLVVFRHDQRVWRQRLALPQYRVLSALLAGRSMASSLALANNGEPVADWFRDFARDGLFVDVSLPKAGRS